MMRIKYFVVFVLWICTQGLYAQNNNIKKDITEALQNADTDAFDRVYNGFRAFLYEEPIGSGLYEADTLAILDIISHIERASESITYESNPDNRIAADMLYSLYTSIIGRYSDAIKSTEAIVDYWEANRNFDKDMYCSILNSLSGYYYAVEDFESSLLCAKKVLKNIKSNNIALYDASLYVAMSELELGNIQSAYKYVKIAYNHPKTEYQTYRATINGTYVEILQSLANSSISKNKPKKFTEYYNEILSIFRDYPDINVSTTLEDQFIIETFSTLLSKGYSKDDINKYIGILAMLRYESYVRFTSYDYDSNDGIALIVRLWGEKALNADKLDIARFFFDYVYDLSKNGKLSGDVSININAWYAYFYQYYDNNHLFAFDAFNRSLEICLKNNDKTEIEEYLNYLMNILDESLAQIRYFYEKPDYKNRIFVLSRTDTEYLLKKWEDISTIIISTYGEDFLNEVLNSHTNLSDSQRVFLPYSLSDIQLIKAHLFIYYKEYTSFAKAWEDIALRFQLDEDAMIDILYRIERLLGLHHNYDASLDFISFILESNVFKKYIKVQEWAIVEKNNHLYDWIEDEVNMAEVEADKGNIDESIKWFDSVLDIICREEGKNFKYLSILNKKAEIAYRNNELATAIEAYEVADSLGRTDFSDSLFTRYSTLVGLATSYNEVADYSRAILICNKLINMLPSLKQSAGESFNDVAEQCVIKQWLACSLWKSFKFSEAEVILKDTYNYAIKNGVSCTLKDEIVQSLLELYKNYIINVVEIQSGALGYIYSQACVYMKENLHLESAFLSFYADDEFMGKILSYVSVQNENLFTSICNDYYEVINDMYKAALNRGSITESVYNNFTGHNTWGKLAYICVNNSLYNEGIKLYENALNECNQGSVKSQYYCNIGDVYFALNDNLNLVKYYVLASDEIIKSEGAYAKEAFSILNSLFLRFKDVIGSNTAYYSRYRQEFATIQMDYEQCLEIIDIVQDYFSDLSQKFGVQYLDNINTYGLKEWEEYELSIGQSFQPSAMYLINPLARCHFERVLLSLLFDRMNEYEDAVNDFLLYLFNECNVKKADRLLLDLVLVICDTLQYSGYYDFSENLLISCLSENQYESETNEMILTKLITDRYKRNDVVGAHELLIWNAANIFEENEGFGYYQIYWDINNLAEQLILLARIYKRAGISKYKECLSIIEQLIAQDSRGINGKQLSEVHKANVFNFLASEASSNEESIAYYQKALDYAPNEIFVKFNLANLLTSVGRYEESDSLLNAISIAISDVYVDSNVKYVISESKLKNSIYKHAEDTYKALAADVLHFAIEDYKINAKTLITSDLANYWNNNYTELLTTITSAEANFGSNGELSYDAALFQKGVLLRNSQNRKYNILHCSDTTLIDSFKKFSYEQQHNTDSVVSAERKMMYYYSLHPEFMQGELVPKWEDVRNTLSKDDLAVEISIMNDIEEGTPYYVAILLKKKSKYPIIVKLCKCDELKRLIENTKLKSGYSTVYDEYANHESVLYQLIWSPIEKYFKGVKNIYFAPHDILNFVNIECLHKKEGKKCISELYNIRRVSTTGNLIKEYNKTYNSAVLFGDIDYNYSVSYSLDSYSIPTSDNEYSQVRGYMPRWKQLVHSLEEIKFIDTKLSDFAVKTNIYTGVEGTEEVFKQLSGSNTSIVHLATHGFYFTSEAAAKNDYFINEQKNNNSSPGIRSGVLFSGANTAWTGYDIPSTSEDGILNSDEILGMDLSGTDLLVLSACQSALGDIQSDGSYGIQRSFKIAGVNSIIMSLWEVDDESTKIMMMSFYNYLSKGLSIKHSFDKAVNEVKKAYAEREKSLGKRGIPKSSRYDSSYYWTSFVLLD